MIDPKTNPDQKPLALEVDPERIPEILKQGRFHVVWRWEWDEARGRWDKPPRQPNGKLAAVNQPDTWVSFEEALEAHRAGTFDGIGVVLTSERELVGIDYDSVADLEARTLAPEAEDTVAQLGSYAEISPSGTGLRVIAKGKLPPGGRRKGKLEMYDSGRYLTLTGHRLGVARGASAEVEGRGAEIIQLHQRVFGDIPRNGVPKQPANSRQETGAIPANDQELLAAARSWRNGGDFSLLYDHGDWKRYHSQSEADQALANYLAFATDRDAGRVDSLFRRSALFREKWDQPHYADGRTYGQGTVEKAMAAVQEGWKPAAHIRRREAAPPVPEDEGLSIPANQILPAPMHWLWKPWIPARTLGMLDGDPGDGKSTLVATIAAHITKGMPWPDGAACGQQGSVIMVGAEDLLAETVVPRLMAAGADLGLVHLIDTFKTQNGERRMPSLPSDVAVFEREIRRCSAVLIVFDPIMPYLAAELSANSDKDVRRALTPFADMLQRTGCTGLLLRHYAKSDKVSNAIYRGLGTIGFTGISRYGIQVARNKNDKELFHFMRAKSNVGKPVKTRDYRITEVTFDSDSGRIETSRIDWQGESEVTNQELLTQEGGFQQKKTVAEDLIRERLEGGDWVESRPILDDLATEGISWDTATRARKRLGVETRKVGMTRGWEWRLAPKTDTDFMRSSHEYGEPMRSSKNAGSWEERKNATARAREDPEEEIRSEDSISGILDGLL